MNIRPSHGRNKGDKDLPESKAEECDQFPSEICKIRIEKN